MPWLFMHRFAATPFSQGGGFRSMFAFWMGGAGAVAVTPPASGLPHNLPFFATMGQLRSF